MNQKVEHPREIPGSSLEKALQTVAVLEIQVGELVGSYSALKRQHLVLERQYQALCQAEQRLRDKETLTREKLAGVIAALKTALTQTHRTTQTIPLAIMETEE